MGSASARRGESSGAVWRTSRHADLREPGPITRRSRGFASVTRARWRGCPAAAVAARRAPATRRAARQGRSAGASIAGQAVVEAKRRLEEDLAVEVARTPNTRPATVLHHPRRPIEDIVTRGIQV